MTTANIPSVPVLTFFGNTVIAQTPKLGYFLGPRIYAQSSLHIWTLISMVWGQMQVLEWIDLSKNPKFATISTEIFLEITVPKLECQSTDLSWLHCCWPVDGKRRSPDTLTKNRQIIMTLSLVNVRKSNFHVNSENGSKHCKALHRPLGLWMKQTNKNAGVSDIHKVNWNLWETHQTTYKKTLHKYI